MGIQDRTDPALVIMAAGIGSRFGGGIKQLKSVGPRGEITIDYSIHDAIEAGFKKIVFIIRRDIEADFREVIGNRIQTLCDGMGVEIRYAFQEKDDLPEGFTVPDGRVKPWGTCHAILACREILHEPYAIINADDYYGKNAYRKLYKFLTEGRDPYEFCMAGFRLHRTLSDNGGVTRGICHMGSERWLTDIEETHNIVKTGDGPMVEGRKLDPQMLVSMNMWGVTPVFMDMLKTGFEKFLREKGQDLKAEFLLPVYIGELLKEGRVKVKVLHTPDTWFGITYKEDTEAVRQAFAELYAEGVYSDPLFSDLG